MKKIWVKDTEFLSVVKKMLYIICALDFITIVIFIAIKGFVLTDLIGVFLSSFLGFINFCVMLHGILNNVNEKKKNPKRFMIIFYIVRFVVLFSIIGVMMYTGAFSVLSITIPIIYATMAFFISLFIEGGKIWI